MSGLPPQGRHVARRAGGSWAIPAPPGSHAAAPAWTTRAAWLNALQSHLATPQGDQWRRDHRYSVAAGTLIAVARIDSAAADTDTGRTMAASNHATAQALGCSDKTVQRARVMLEDAGFYATTAPGRYLTTQERDQARHTHGGTQLRAASTRALTLPHWAAVQNVHLPVPPTHTRAPTLIKTPKPRAHARGNAAARRAATTTTPSRAASRRRHAPPAPSPALLIWATQLAGRLPWLKNLNRTSVCAIIRRTKVDTNRYSVQDIIALHDARNHSLGLTALEPGQVRHPAGYLWQQLTQTMAWAQQTGYETIQERHNRDVGERDQRRHAAAQRHKDDEELRNRINSPDQDAAIQAILRQMHATYRSSQRCSAQHAGL